MATPSFPASMDPAHYVRRIVHEPHQTTARVTAQRDLFVLAHLGIPRVDPALWRLEIAGLVKRPLTLSLDEIRRRPATRVESFHQCAGAPRRPDLATRRIANVQWEGVELAPLLAECGVAAEARYLWASGLDGGQYDGLTARWYMKDMPLSRLKEGGVLLAYAVNGEALSPEHGFPLRLVIPGWYGTNAVKWLWRLELASGRAEGPFTTALYNDPDPKGTGTRPVWEAGPEALIVAPAPGPVARERVEIWGWAWAARGMARVEVSLDGGESWAAAGLEPRREWSWQRFSYEWRAERPGAATLMARATDAQGVTQPPEKARNAVHRVEVTVS